MVFKKTWITIILTGILILAAVLRLYRLTDFPGGFNADEAAIGYNAYSLLQTGHDEHGAAWPITAFKSFGDYKAPLYFYLVLPFVAIMGLTELAVRLPAALLGIATVYMVYLLGKRFFHREVPALTGALMLAISPWHLHFSRGGWEVTAATFFMATGLYAFLRAIESGEKSESPKESIRYTVYSILYTPKVEASRWYVFSLLGFLAALYTYQSPKIILPLLGFGLIFLYKQTLWRQRFQLIGPILIALVVAIPLVLTFTSGGGTARFSGVSIFSDTGPYWAINQARGEHDNIGSLPAKVFHNKVVGYGLNYLKNYSAHFTPDFLFAKGDVIDRNKIPEMGVLYIADAVFLLLGLGLLFHSSHQHKKVLFLWLVVAPTAAALTFQAPHALRAANMAVPLAMIVGYGVGESIRLLWSKRKIITICYTLFAICLYAFCFAKYLHLYYVRLPLVVPLANNYGFDELVSYVESVKDQYDKIVVTDRYDQPYILFLFYSKKDPRSFQRQVVLTPRDKFGFSTVLNYDTYEFRAIKIEDLTTLHKTLIIGTDKEIPDDASNIKKIIRFPNGQPAFKVVST